MAIHESLMSEAAAFDSTGPIGSDMTLTVSEKSSEDSRPHVYVLDSLAREVHLSGRRVRLTAREFNFLVYLLGRRGQVVSRGDALRSVWGGAYGAGSRTVDVHVQRLRAKLGEALKLHTVRGTGYLLSE